MDLYLEISGNQIDGAREYQEDAFLTTYLDDDTGHAKASALVIVADGMGGHAAGNIASHLVVSTFNKWITGHFGQQELSTILREALDISNDSLRASIKETPALDGMGCTMVTAAFARGKVWWISVGDSHLYLVRDRELVKKNEDHSYGGYLDRMKEQGLDVEPEPGLSRNMLMSALTGDEIAEIDCPQEGFQLLPGDRVIIATDGLDSISDGAVLQYSAWSKTAKECVEAFLKAVEEAGKPRQDNTTVVVVDVLERGVAREEQKPTESLALGDTVPLDLAEIEAAKAAAGKAENTAPLDLAEIEAAKAVAGEGAEEAIPKKSPAKKPAAKPVSREPVAEEIPSEVSPMEGLLEQASAEEEIEIPSLDDIVFEEPTAEVPVESAPQERAFGALYAEELKPKRGRGLLKGLMLLALVAAGAGGYYYYTTVYRQATETAPPVVSLPRPPSPPATPPESVARAKEPAPPPAVVPRAAPKPAPVAKPAPAPVPKPVPQTVKPVPAGKEFRDSLKAGGKGPPMIAIPAGSFAMGSGTLSVNAEERPRRNVRMKAFAVSKYEVTFAEYERFARATGRKIPDNRYLEKDIHPVFYVSWDDAYEYTRWLSAQTGKSYRLLSEAEWEYMARAGTKTPYWWGFEVGENQAHCFGCETGLDPRKPTRVGRFKPNPFGVYDTQGNVMEWVHDCYHGDYQGAPEDGRVWEGGDCTYRMARGGSYNSPPPSIRTQKRNKLRSMTGYDTVGIRLARDL